MKYILFLFINILFLSTLSGQDFHFSQLEMSPLHLNPALTGRMEGKHRIVMKYREQWKSVLSNRRYKTAFLSYDTQFDCFNEGSYFALGATAVFDEVGTHRFTTYLGNISGAFHLRVEKKRFFAFGVQAGVVSYALKGRTFKFDTQFGATGFDTNADNFETFDNFGHYFIPPALDINVGAVYYTTNFEFGASIFHFNRPTLSFLGTSEKSDSRLNLRLVLHGLVPLHRQRDDNIFSFKFLVMAQKITPAVLNWQTVSIFQYKRKFDDGFLGTFGIGGRLTKTAVNKNLSIDAAIISLQLEWSSNLILGFSYEFNVSPLAAVSLLRSGPEMSLIWLIGEQSICVVCPNGEGFKTF